MQILDQDMQMVRAFLKKAKAPECIKGHFENLVEQHAKEADAAATLEDENKALREEESERYQKLEEEYDDYKRDAKEEADDRALSALETIRYWLLDVLVHGRPMQKPPRSILRIVEDAL